MDKNKKIISSALALALGISLIIPNAKANEEKAVDKALKEPVKTSEKASLGEKSAVVKEENTIKKAPAKEGEETPADGEEKAKNETEKPKDKTENPAGGEEKPADKQEKPAGGQEKPKEEKKVKPKEYKMSELLNEKGAFEKRKQAELDFLRFEIYNEERNEMGPNEEVLRKMKLQYEKLPKATTWEEMGEILGYNKEYFARSVLSMKVGGNAYDSELVKIIDDMANQKPQNPSPKNPIRKNKKTATTNSQKTKNTGTTNSQKTINTGNKVNNAGVNVQTGVGSLSAILGLLGASSLGLFKSKRK